MIIKLLFLAADGLRMAARSQGMYPSMPDCCTQKEIPVSVYPYNHRTLRNLNKTEQFTLQDAASVSAIFPPALRDVRNMISHNALIYPGG